MSQKQHQDMKHVSIYSTHKFLQRRYVHACVYVYIYTYLYMYVYIYAKIYVGQASSGYILAPSEMARCCKALSERYGGICDLLGCEHCQSEVAAFLHWPCHGNNNKDNKYFSYC